MAVRVATTSYDPWDSGFIADPYPAYAQLRDTGPAIWHEPTRQWLIPRYADVHSLLRDRRLGRTYLHRFTHEEFGRAPPPAAEEAFHTLNGNGLLDLEPPNHSRIRRLVSKAFTPRTLERLTPAIEVLASSSVARLVAEGGGDLVSAVAEPLPVSVIAEMLAIPDDDRQLLRPWSAAITAMFEMNPGVGAVEDAVRASVEFSDYIRALIAVRRERLGDDLISALIVARDEGDRLSVQEMISTCVLLLNAGHEATVNATGTGWWTLFRNPDQLDLLRSRPEIIPSAIEELLRYDTPAQMFERWVLDDVAMGDVMITRGSEVALLLGSANRDPSRFQDPDILDLTRSDNKHLTFGAGIHFCLGAPLARIELVASFRALLDHAPDLRLAREPEWKPGYVIRGLHELWVEC